MSNWKRYIQWAEWLLTIAAMGYLVYRLCTYEHYDTLGTTLVGLDIRSWMLCLLAVVLIPVQLFIEVLRWKATLRGWKTITLSESWSQVLLGMLAGFVTPYRTGDIPARLVAAGLDEEGGMGLAMANMVEGLDQVVGYSRVDHGPIYHLGSAAVGCDGDDGGAYVGTRGRRQYCFLLPHDQHYAQRTGSRCGTQGRMGRVDIRPA